MRHISSLTYISVLSAEVPSVRFLPSTQYNGGGRNVVFGAHITEELHFLPRVLQLVVFLIIQTISLLKLSKLSSQ